MRCGNCGSEMSETDYFCKNCGWHSPENAEMPQPAMSAVDREETPQTAKKTLPMPLFIGCACLIVIVVAGIIVVRTSGGGDSAPAVTTEENMMELSSVPEAVPVSEDSGSGQEPDVLRTDDGVTPVLEASAKLLSDEELEEEVKRIRQVWNSDRESVADGTFAVDTIQQGIRRYSLGGEIRMFEVDRDVWDGYKRIFQIEDGRLTFVYYESAAEQVRLYFYQDMLFRWIQTGADGQAVIHDNEQDNMVFQWWEQKALDEAADLLSQ